MTDRLLKVDSIETKEWNLLLQPIDLYMYEIPFVTKEWCSYIIDEANKLNKWTDHTLPRSLREDRNKNYPTYDILLEDIDKDTNDIYCQMLQEYMVDSMKWFYKITDNIWDDLKFENFIVKYTPDKQQYLSVHHDHSLISTMLTLNDKSEFQGGGTWFQRQNYLHFGEVGHLSVHPSNITHKHGARPVTSGSRYVLITFTWTPDWFKKRRKNDR
tara:strand:- start:644 stop:1285 length:642 start_codon:yes stop_codon:yes gene_type:complete